VHAVVPAHANRHDRFLRFRFQSVCAALIAVKGPVLHLQTIHLCRHDIHGCAPLLYAACS
jgi:hypothetical protein